MKKILAVLGAITLSSTTIGSVVSCGLDGKQWKTITVGIVDNGKDKTETEMMDKIKEEYDEKYGDLGYKIQFKVYEDENKIPEQVLAVGNSKNIPDIYAPTVNQAAWLANNGYILALNGKNSPWNDKDDPDSGASILKNLNYNKEGQAESQELLNQIMSDIEKGQPVSVSKEDQWNHFLPYVVEASKFKSINTSNPDDEVVQYGITKHVGVGGGNAIFNTSEGKFDQLFIDLGLVDIEEPRKEDGTFNWITDAKASIDKIVKVMLENPEKEKQIFTLVDRGMWWMYPVYANAMADINGKELNASKIGVNWIREQYKEQGIDDSRQLKYSSIFGNQHFTKSTTEIMEKWFQLFGAMTINAKYLLEHHDNYDPDNENWNYLNLFDPNANAGVQKELLRNGLAAGVNYEPGSYFDMLEGFNLFSNMDYLPLGVTEIFDHENEKEIANKYIDAGLNTWLTPAGSGQYVFNRNLINSKLDPKMEKAEAAMRFIELTFGFYKDEDGDMASHNDGGVRNLKYQFAKTGDNPIQLAILDESNQDDPDFKNAIDEKVNIKFNRAKDEMPNWWKSVKNDESLQDKERKAIFRLETTSITLAANLYKLGGAALSLAPNRSAFDEASSGDYHGNAAMKPALLATLGKDNISNWGLKELKTHGAEFADKLIQSLAAFDKTKSDED